MNLWAAFKRNVTPETLNEIAEREFEDIIQQITQETISETITKMKAETTNQVQQIKTKLQREINALRLQIQYQKEEIEKLKQQAVHD